MIETFLTIIVPGLGHYYYGYNRKAFILILIFILGAYCIPLYLFLYPYALYDIWKISKNNPRPTFKKAEAIQIILIGLIVPMILGLCLAIGGPLFLSFYKNKISFPNKVDSLGKEIVNSLERYYESYSRYPERLDIIIADNPLRKRWRSDPWGNPFYYKTSKSKNSYELLSYGLDGKLGTDDDVVFSKRTKTSRN